MFKRSEQLAIEGFNGLTVPNSFLRQAAGSQSLALFFPGLNYNCDMPLFYYAQEYLDGRGDDLLRVEYDYRADYLSLAASDRHEQIDGDATAAYLAGLGQGEYRRVTLIGKSLGTIAIARLLATGAIADVEARFVWLTPILHNETVREQIRRLRQQSMIVIGTDDPDYDPALLDELAAAEAVVAPGADHGFDIPGDVPGSVQAVASVVEALQRFLRE